METGDTLNIQVHSVAELFKKGIDEVYLDQGITLPLPPVHIVCVVEVVPDVEHLENNASSTQYQPPKHSEPTIHALASKHLISTF